MEENTKDIRKSNKRLIGSVFKIMAYLKRNTDPDHPTSQKQMRADGEFEELSELLGNKTTFHNKMVNMAMALDFSDGVNINKREDCRLIFKSVDDMLKASESTGLPEDLEDSLPEEQLKSTRGIYYNHPFSFDEVTDIINAVNTAKIIEEDKKAALIEKIKYELTSKNYKAGKVTIHNKENTDSAELCRNIRVIQQAICSGTQISFYFNYYFSDYSLKHSKYVISLSHTNNKRSYVSPHYIVTDNGRYYMLGCFESKDVQFTSVKKKLCVYRIDLMTDVKLRKSGGKLMPATKVQQVTDAVMGDNLEQFKKAHLGMSYDSPSTVTIKVENPYKDTNSLTFVKDAFGDDCSITEHHKAYDIIEVRTSKFGIVNWALQYSDKVTVLSPDDVVDSIKDKIEKLKNKYDSLE